MGDEIRQLETGAGGAKRKRVRRFYSWLQVFLGLMTTGPAFKWLLDEGPYESVVLNKSLAVALAAIGLRLLYLEIRGPLLALDDDGITVREYARARFEKIPWEHIQTVEGRGRQMTRMAVLVLRDGDEIQVPIHVVLLPKPDDLIEEIQAWLGKGREAGS